MNAPTIVICGLTATGKTSLALRIAKALKGEIVSADSRQVYKELTLLSGKDIPKGFIFELNSGLATYTDGRTRIWGYDLASTHEDYSAAQYYLACRAIVNSLKQRATLPIVVGGTGLYIETLFNPPKTLLIKRDEDLRDKLEQFELSKLQNELQTVDLAKFEQMNDSDRNNSRRLVRAIEVASAREKALPSPLLDVNESLWIGLTMPMELLEKKVTERVLERSEQPHLRHEVMAIDDGLPAASATGINEMKAHYRGNLTLDEARLAWTKREIDYAKRQWVWFKRYSQITWFDVSKDGWQGQVEERIKTWYATHYSDAINH